MSYSSFSFFINENLPDSALDCSYFNAKFLCCGKNYKLKIKVQIENDLLVFCLAFIATKNERCCIQFESNQFHLSNTLKSVSSHNTRKRKFSCCATKLNTLSCNILICHHCPVHRSVHKLNTCLCMVCPKCCAVLHLACTAQPRGQTGMEQEFTFTCVE